MSEQNYIAFLEQLAAGCVSGRFSEWPQLKPAVSYVLGELANARRDTEGSVVVPKEPSDEMIRAGLREMDYAGALASVSDIWEAMINHRPKRDDALLPPNNLR